MISTRHLKRTDTERQQVKERLLQYVDLLGVSDSRFCLDAGLDRRFLNSFTGNPSKKIRDAIIRTYPALNMNWVLFGTGGMINKGYEKEEDQRKVVPHRKPEGNVNISNGCGASLTQTGKINNIEVGISEREPITLDDIAGHGLSANLTFTKLLMEKDKLIAEKDRFIQKLLAKIDELSAPCK